VVGQTQSSNRVSNYVSELEKTDIIAKASIIEVKTVLVRPQVSSKTTLRGDDIRINEFSVELVLRKKIEINAGTQGTQAGQPDEKKPPAGPATDADKAKVSVSNKDKEKR